MKLFGINLFPSKRKKPKITPNDREWVEGNFLWLVNNVSSPSQNQISISENHFPKTFSTREIQIENLIADLCDYLELEKAHFSFEIHKDLRDIELMPYALENPQDCILNYDEANGNFKLHIANNLLKHPNWLIELTSYHLTRAKLIKKGVNFDTGSDTGHFIFLAAVYFGFGVIIGQNLWQTGRGQDGIIENQWSRGLDIPLPIIAYSLALYSKIRKDPDPAWKDELPEEIKKEFETCLSYLNKDGQEVSEANRIDTTLNAYELSELSFDLYNEGNFKKANDLLEKVVEMNVYDGLTGEAYNNIGYNHLRMGNFKESIPFFLKALKIAPGFGFPNDNIGFAYIMTGELEKGKEYLEKAMESENNIHAYSYRNMALYHQKRKEMELAEEQFQKAFNENVPVDLLDFYYGLFQLEKGDKALAKKHIEKSAEIGENEAIEFLNKL